MLFNDITTSADTRPREVSRSVSSIPKDVCTCYSSRLLTQPRSAKSFLSSFLVHALIPHYTHLPTVASCSVEVQLTSSWESCWFYVALFFRSDRKLPRQGISVKPISVVTSTTVYLYGSNLLKRRIDQRRQNEVKNSYKLLNLQILLIPKWCRAKNSMKLNWFRRSITQSLVLLLTFCSKQLFAW